MVRNREYKPAERCAYRAACYLADELKCYGYKVDCVLYRKTNGEPLPEAEFHQAMDRLIDRTREKYLVKAR